MDIQEGFAFDISEDVEENFPNTDFLDISGWPMDSGDSLDNMNLFNEWLLSPIQPQLNSYGDALGRNVSLEIVRDSVKRDQQRKGKPLELDILEEYHFGTVLPRLRSLVPQHYSDSFTHLPTIPFVYNEYSRDYLKLLVVAMSNNFAAIEDLPILSIFDYIETRFTTKQIGMYLTTLPKSASHAFEDGLLRCALYAGKAGMTEFVLARPGSCIGVHDTVRLPYFFKNTIWEYVLNSQNVPLARVLLKYGVDVNGVLPSGNEIPLLRAVGFFRPCPDFIFFLLDAGACVTARTVLSLLQSRQCEDRHVKVLQRLISQCTPALWSRHEKGEIFMAAMDRLLMEYCEEFADFMIRNGAELNDEHLGTGMRHQLGIYGEPEPRFIIDASASRGDHQLVQVFLKKGALLTKDTLEHAVWSGNVALVSHLINEADVPDHHDLSDSLLRTISSSKNMEMIALLEQHNILSQFCRERRCVLEIFNEIQTGHADALKTLLRQMYQNQRNPPENSFDRKRRMAEDLCSCLLEAIRAGREDMARILIDGGASLRPPLRRGYDEQDQPSSPLLAAVEAKTVKIIQDILDAGANPNEDSTRSPLSAAIQWGEVSVVQDLILAGAMIDSSACVGSSSKDERLRMGICLAFAVKEKNLKLVQYLLEAGADPSATASHFPEITPLEASVENRDQAMIELLFSYGCDPADSAALKAAVEDHSVKIVQMLLRHFVQRYPHGKTRYGSKALQNAVLGGQVGLVKLLIEGKVDIRSAENTYPYRGCAASPLAITVETDRSVDQNLLRLFLQSGIGSNEIVSYEEWSWIHDSTGNPPRYTALLRAIETDNHPAVHASIEFGADVNWKPKLGPRRTPLQCASEKGKIDMVELLLREGASVNGLPASRGGATALQLAAIGGYVGVAELLLEHGAEINAAPAKVHGRSAINGAAEHGRFHMVEFLLRHGAELEPDADHDDCEAVRLAKENGHMAVADRLREHLDGVRDLESLKQSHSILPPSSSAGRPICEGCGDTFKNKSSLARHSRTKHASSSSDTNLEHECTFCTMTFKRKDMLTRHESTHTNAMRASCETCGKEFSRKDYLKAQHLDEHGKCKDFATGA